MLHTMKRGLFVGTAVAVVAALCIGSALAARGHTRFSARAAHGFMGGGFGPFARTAGGGFGLMAGGGMMFGGPGMGGPGMGDPGMGGPGMQGPGMMGMHGDGPGMRGPGGGGILATEVLKTSATYLGISLTDLQTDLKGGKTLAQEATAKGKTAAGLITALTTATKGNLDAAVAAGWITQKQADAVLEGATKTITELVDNGPPVPGEQHAGPLDAAATYLGVTTADLKTALQGGKTLAQVAADKGKTVAGLVTALTADAKTRLDKAVTDGNITQAQETAILTELTTRVTDFVNGVHGPKAATTTTNAIKHAMKFTVRR
jgi:hypothetical protein